jgi:hypothetical protein
MRHRCHCYARAASAATVSWLWHFHPRIRCICWCAVRDRWHWRLRINLHLFGLLGIATGRHIQCQRHARLPNSCAFCDENNCYRFFSSPYSDWLRTAWPRGRSSSPGMVKNSRPRPDRLWGTASLQSNGCRALFPLGWSGRCLKLTTHLQLVPMLRKRGSVHPLPHTSSWCSAWLVKHRDNFTFSASQYSINKEPTITSNTDVDAVDSQLVGLLTVSRPGWIQWAVRSRGLAGVPPRTQLVR